MGCRRCILILLFLTLGSSLQARFGPSTLFMSVCWSVSRARLLRRNAAHESMLWDGGGFDRYSSSTFLLVPTGAMARDLSYREADALIIASTLRVKGRSRLTVQALALSGYGPSERTGAPHVLLNSQGIPVLHGRKKFKSRRAGRLIFSFSLCLQHQVRPSSTIGTRTQAVRVDCMTGI